MCSRDDVFHCLSHSLLWLQLNTPTQWHARTIPNDTHTHWEYTDTILYVLLYSCASMYLHLYFVDVLFVLSVCVRWILCNVFRFRFSSFSLYRIIISSSYFFLLNTFRLLSSPFNYLFSFCFIKWLFFSLFSWFSLSLTLLGTNCKTSFFFLGKLQYCDTKETEANKLIMHTLSLSYTNTHEAQGKESTWFFPSWTIERTRKKKPKVIQTWLAYFYIKFIVVDWITKIIKCKIC